MVSTLSRQQSLSIILRVVCVPCLHYCVLDTCFRVDGTFSPSLSVASVSVHVTEDSSTPQLTGRRSIGYTILCKATWRVSHCCRSWSGSMHVCRSREASALCTLIVQSWQQNRGIIPAYTIRRAVAKVATVPLAQHHLVRRKRLDSSVF